MARKIHTKGYKHHRLRLAGLHPASGLVRHYRKPTIKWTIGQSRRVPDEIFRGLHRIEADETSLLTAALANEIASSLGLPAGQLIKYAAGRTGASAILSAILGALGGRMISASELASLSRLGSGVMDAIKGWMARRPTPVRPAPPFPSASQPPSIPPTPPPSALPGASGGQPPQRPSRFTPERQPGATAPKEPETLTPQSSNVYSFSYDAEGSILYVTYKGHVLNPKSIHVGPGRHGGREHLKGKLGSTVTSARTNTPGAQYAYFDVPARVYDRMKRAASKGKFVWDELRIRGTIYGFQYRYSLVQGQANAGLGKAYIPRRATKRGFIVRSVADQGVGRRGFESSTLATQQFRPRTPTMSGRRPRGGR